MSTSQRQRPYLTRVRTTDAAHDALPPFPPPGIVLHPDDAASKVFQAVARAFVSVDNRAMTIKDIADRASQYGLVCQNLSAAAQAVTTYLRAHKARCDRQQDQPLLMSHTLSGTPADDDLVPALFSRTGGDSALPSEGRLTNFRKGTAVWYLSRATGVACPFTRAGIRLCDYVQHDDDVIEKGGRREVSCGLKRKRPLRGCVRHESEEDEDEEQRPPKVKLTLRLKPLLAKTTPPVEPQPEGSTSARPIDVSESDDDDDDDSDDSMPVDSSDDEDSSQEPAAQVSQETAEGALWSLPPYPRPSISIPSYMPSTESYPSYPTSTPYKDLLRRSPSACFATPPPDSDDDADDFHVAMTNIKTYPEAEDDDNDIGFDADLDSEGEEEGETVWESPGPRSPSAPLIHPTEVTVKEEPRDVQGMLDAWEDFDTSIAVAEVLSKALESDARTQVKQEPVDPWDWDANHSGEWASEDMTRIKQEDFGVESLFPSGPSSSPLSPISSLASHFAAFPYFDTQPGSEPDDDIAREYPTVRPRAKTVPVPSPFFPTSSSGTPPPSLSRASISSSVPSREPSVPSTALVMLLQTMSVNTAAPPAAFTLPPPTPCVSPLQTRCQPSFSLNRPVVVTTCQPCKPAISATQIEEIAVYQMILGAFQLLRRIDTDFVNLAPILAIAGAALAAGEVPQNAMVVTKGSPEICGTWVPLAAAQAYVQMHLADAAGKCAEGDLEALQVFLSHSLVELFPPALQDFHRATPARGLNQFGCHFTSTLQAARWEAMDGSAGSVSASVSGSSAGSTPGSLVAANTSASASSPLPPPMALGNTRPFLLGGIGDRHIEKDTPLSATEQQLFHELCVIPDWDQEGSMDVEMASPVDPLDMPAPIILLTELPTSPPPQAPMSPLSVFSESPLSSPMSSPTISARPVIPTAMRKRTESTETQKPSTLRRSKRVADAQLAQPVRAMAAPGRGRGRKGAASRNSLS